MSIYKECETCEGYGTIETCDNCNELSETCHCEDPMPSYGTCPDCNGDGKILKETNNTNEDY